MRAPTVAVDRRDDLRIGQVQRGLLFDRARMRQLCLGLGAFGGENINAAPCCKQARLAVLQLCGFLAERRIGLLRVLDRSGAGLHQLIVAGLFLLGEFQIGFRRRNIRAALFDHGLLQGQLSIEIAHRGLGSGDIGLGLIQRGLEVAIVDPRQHLASLHRLVVADQHLREIAGDLRRDDGGVGLNIGVIGRFQVAAGAQVVSAELRQTGDPEREHQRQGRAPDRPPRRAKAYFLF